MARKDCNQELMVRSETLMVRKIAQSFARIRPDFGLKYCHPAKILDQKTLSS